MKITLEQEPDGRWFASVDSPAKCAYGETPEEACSIVRALALETLVDREVQHKKLVEFYEKIGNMIDVATLPGQRELFIINVIQLRDEMFPRGVSGGS